MFVDLLKINPAHLNPDMLVGKYIPNLIAKPFQVSREYAQIIYDQTSSPHFDKVLKKWEEDKWTSAENRQQLAYIILVELLAYQFAFLLRWVETQDLLFTSFKLKRLVELGPSPTLTGMATHTLKAKYETLDGSISRARAILCPRTSRRSITNMRTRMRLLLLSPPLIPLSRRPLLLLHPPPLQSLFPHPLVQLPPLRMCP